MVRRSVISEAVIAGWRRLIDPTRRYGTATSKITCLSKRETLRKVVREHISLSRFGDGELVFCEKFRSLRFQKFHPELRERLLRALLQPESGVLPAFNHHFRDHGWVEWIVNYERYPKAFDRVRSIREAGDVGVLDRRRERRSYQKQWRDIEKTSAAPEYGDAAVFFLGSYVDEYAQGGFEEVIESFRALFTGRRILFVCPKKPLGGQGFEAQQDALKELGLQSAQFITIPSSDAYAVGAWIEAEILRARGYDDVFIQAGPLASVLANELSSRIDGRILDVGSLNTQIRYLR